MNLQEALTRIGTEFNLSPAQLIAHAAEDDIGGYSNSDASRKWPVGSIWGVEGQVIYALVRALKPHRLLEIGTFYGCSATHMATAIHANEGIGRLLCVDNLSMPGSPQKMGAAIPKHLSHYIEFVNGDALTTDLTGFDFVFEDGAHDREFSRAIWARIPQLLNPGGIIITHDSEHFIVGEDIRQGIKAAGYEPLSLLIEPSDCGLALWRAPGERQPEEPPKPKRPRRKRTTTK